MLSFLKKIFRTVPKEEWIWEASELAKLPVGTKIIENGGVTEGGPATEFTKRDDGKWEYSYAMANYPNEVVSEKSFNMPFMVVFRPGFM